MKYIENKQEYLNLIENNELVVVDFYADWCGPCRMLSPTIEALAEKYAGKAAVVKLNVDNVDEIPQLYRVQSIPTVIFVKKGQEVNRIVGYRAQGEFEAVINSLL